MTSEIRKLSTHELKLLQALVASARSLERIWAQEETLNSSTQDREQALTQFLTELDRLESSDSDLLRKLFALRNRFSMSMTAKHLAGLIVPFERLLGRAVRDEEFLFNQSDQAKSSLIPRSTGSGGRIVLCENIRSAFNLGSVLRTAESFGFDAVWLTGYTARADEPSVQKTAMGSDQLIETRSFSHSRDAIAEAKARGYTIVALETGVTSIPASEYEWPEKYILCLGNERFGLDSETLDSVDARVSLPQKGIKNSMNVGVAFGAACMAAEQQSNRGAKEFNPIGYARTPYLLKQTAPRQGHYREADAVTKTARIELLKNFRGRPSLFDQALKDLDGFDRIWLVFEFHETQSYKPQVVPPRGEAVKRGVFATRSPHRPNRFGLTSARLLSVDGFNLEITEHDLLDGTPIYDIKPYIEGADSFSNIKNGWVDTIETFRFAIAESEEFTENCNWLIKHGENRIRDFVFEQLSFDPTNDQRKRVCEVPQNSSEYEVSFRTWRLRFQINEVQRSIRLLKIDSGYSSADLASLDDPYGDKDLHREFHHFRSLKTALKN